MSTYSPDPLQPEGVALAGEPSPAGFGLPDTDTIAQLANALFAALPGRPSVPGTAADAQAAPPSSALSTESPVAQDGEFASHSVAPYVSPTSGFSPPSEVELRTAPASLSSAGGTTPASTSANPPEEELPYFLDPAQPALPGVALGLGPAQASRLESGAVPTSPSPPSAIAQPAEPNLRSAPVVGSEAAGLTPSGAAGLSAAQPFAFRPELVPAEPSLSGLSTNEPSPVNAAKPAAPEPAQGSATGLPQNPGVEPAPEAVPTSPAITAQVPVSLPQQETGYYFLNPENQAAQTDGLANFDPYGVPGLLPDLSLDLLALDARNPTLPAEPPSGIQGLGAH